MTDRPAEPEPQIDAALVRRLVAAQFPDWADLPVTPAEPQGWDNRSFRLGEAMVVRLPSVQRYAAQVGKEQRWLPVLAPHLPLAIPEPLAQGVPDAGYPYDWSVYRWLPGQAARAPLIAGLPGFAADLARFLRALHGIPAVDGPPPGAHNFHRGGDLVVYEAEALDCAAALAGEIDAVAAIDCWAAARGSAWQHAPVWVHGDLAPDNLLVRDGKLAAVIDFGSSAVGDPACDLVIAWTLFDGEARAAFRLALPLDSDTWARARGWALWKALLVVRDGTRPDTALHRRALEAVLADHAASR